MFAVSSVLTMVVWGGSRRAPRFVPVKKVQSLLFLVGGVDIVGVVLVG